MGAREKNNAPARASNNLTNPKTLDLCMPLEQSRQEIDPK